MEREKHAVFQELSSWCVVDAQGKKEAYKTRAGADEAARKLKDRDETTAAVRRLMRLIDSKDEPVRELILRVAFEKLGQDRFDRVLEAEKRLAKRLLKTRDGATAPLYQAYESCFWDLMNLNWPLVLDEFRTNCFELIRAISQLVWGTEADRKLGGAEVWQWAASMFRVEGSGVDRALDDRLLCDEARVPVELSSVAQLRRRCSFGSHVTLIGYCQRHTVTDLSSRTTVKSQLLTSFMSPVLVEVVEQELRQCRGAAEDLRRCLQSRVRLRGDVTGEEAARRFVCFDLFRPRRSGLLASAADRVNQSLEPIEDSVRTAGPKMISYAGHWASPSLWDRDGAPLGGKVLRAQGSVPSPKGHNAW